MYQFDQRVYANEVTRDKCQVLSPEALDQALSVRPPVGQNARDCVETSHTGLECDPPVCLAPSKHHRQQGLDVLLWPADSACGVAASFWGR